MPGHAGSKMIGKIPDSLLLGNPVALEGRIVEALAPTVVELSAAARAGR